VPRRKPATAPPMAAPQPQKGPKPGRKKRTRVGTVYQMDQSRRTPEEVVEALVREPEAAARRDEAAPYRPVPKHKRVRVHLHRPEAATSARPPTAMFAWLADEAQSRDPVRPRAWGGDPGRAAVVVGAGRADIRRGPAGEDLGPAPCHPSPRGGGVPVPRAWQRRGAEADGAGGMGAARGDE
jgi:hypothetical protein